MDGKPPNVDRQPQSERHVVWRPTVVNSTYPSSEDSTRLRILGEGDSADPTTGLVNVRAPPLIRFLLIFGGR